MRSILRHLNILNIALIVSVGLFASYMLLPLINMKVEFGLPSPAKKALANAPAPEIYRSQPQIPDFSTIASNNLFHPERKIPAAQVQEAERPRPEFVLYGTLIAPDTKVAYMEDIKNPYNTAGRGQRQRRLKENDALSGYTIKEIAHDKVVMIKGEEKLEVSVIDPARPKARAGAASTASAPHVRAEPAKTVQPASEALQKKEQTAQKEQAPQAEGKPQAPRPETKEQPAADKADVFKRPGFLFRKKY